MNSAKLIINLTRSVRRIRCPRLYSTQEQPLQVPEADGVEKTYPPHIHEIVDKISQLTLMEVADLNSCLKTRLNIPDAPMMPMGMHMMGAAAAEPEKTEEESAPQVQSLFTVRLAKFEDSKKIALIKEVKKLMGDMNLVQAKKFVESVPVTVKEDLTKEEAETLKSALEAAGGVVEME
ncbi:large ribosomal subunit protein bL12m-like [Watersipora subatra]|uniref:large ribosomal subunit protein bL12m-like n=1 Tax=Watersipora subatra TaxID=2589382 RepID=UPI00355B7022